MQYYIVYPYRIYPKYDLNEQKRERRKQKYRELKGKIQRFDIAERKAWQNPLERLAFLIISIIIIFLVI